MEENKSSYTNGHDQEEIKPAPESGSPPDTEFGDEFFVEKTTAKMPEDFDLDDYRAGSPLKLAQILALPSSRRADVRKPRKEFFQSHPDVSTWQTVYLFEGDGINEFYIVSKAVALEMPDEISQWYLVPCINPSGQVFLWPIKHGEGSQEFAELALEHADKARNVWLRRKWMARKKTYKIEINDIEEKPEWPENFSVEELVARAFVDKRINSLDHPCFRFTRNIGR